MKDFTLNFELNSREDKIEKEIEGVDYVKFTCPVTYFTIRIYRSGEIKRGNGDYIHVGKMAGYNVLDLRSYGARKGYRVARLVAISFIENPENKPCVNHKNGIKDDDRELNLEWVTDSENMKHAFDTGLQTLFKKRGIENINARFSFEEICEMREMRNIQKKSYSHIASVYGCSKSLVEKVVNNRIRINE